MSQTKREKIEKLLESIKIKADDINQLEKEFDNILEMFDQLRQVEVDENIEAEIKKIVSLADLREDVAKESNLFAELKNKYIVLPNKKN